MQIPISPENYPIFNSLASPTRLQILNLLAEGPSNIHSLAQAVGITPTMAVKHIRQLEAAGLVVSETLPGKRGMQKLCRLKDTHLVLTFTTREESANCCSYSMPVGMYVDCDVKAPCGLATTSSIIRLADDPAFFMAPEHADAALVWFSEGWIEYALPNYLSENMRLRQLRLSFEICSEAKGFREDWPSDIHFTINQKFIGFWRSPGDFGAVRGAFTPKWWNFGSQYGIRKTITVNERGTFIDGLPAGEPGCTLADFAFEPKKPIRFRIASPPEARHPGGVNLFGKGFGNYDQDILVYLDYETE